MRNFMIDGVELMVNSTGLSEAKNMVFIQSFDPNVLRLLRSMTELPLVMLLRSKSDLQPSTPNIALADVIPFVDVIGASKHLILGPLGEDTGFVASAMQYGVPVHAWTIRDDAAHMAYKSVQSEILALHEAGVAGLFTDFPDTAVRLLEASKPQKNTRLGRVFSLRLNRHFSVS